MRFFFVFFNYLSIHLFFFLSIILNLCCHCMSHYYQQQQYVEVSVKMRITLKNHLLKKFEKHLRMQPAEKRCKHLYIFSNPSIHSRQKYLNIIAMVIFSLLSLSLLPLLLFFHVIIAFVLSITIGIIITTIVANIIITIYH